jgi:hypothetical protein
MTPKRAKGNASKGDGIVFFGQCKHEYQAETRLSEWFMISSLDRSVAVGFMVRVFGPGENSIIVIFRPL